MSSIWPTAVATDANLYIAVNSLETNLSGSITNAVTTIGLNSTSNFPTVGTILVDNEVIKYTGISGSNLTGCTRGFDGTTAVSHASAAVVSFAVVADHHNVLKNEMEAVETTLSNIVGLSATLPLTASKVMVTDGSGHLSTSTVTPTTLAFLDVSSSVQTLLNTKASTASPSFTGTISTPLANTKVVTTDGSGNLATGAATMGGALAMGANKVTGLANGTISTDAAAFGQIPITNVVTIHKASDDSTTSTSFTSTTFTVTITPSSSNAKILLLAAGTGYSTANSTCIYTITNTTSSTNLGGTNGLTSNNVFTALDGLDFGVSILAVDSPASAIAQTYAIQIRCGGSSQNTHFGDAYGYLVAMEIH